ncbi:hypothetical protein D6C84_07567 [Aureobasidium pullulans]|uniref:BTB domain-containing protein n=1 Tax=Aureobasidium pullulans TaxID=5580 RepID=A0A4S9XQB9_AURPU|nr:hypothetical protein D6C84_07567 [Aureobasidium pullulans]
MNAPSKSTTFATSSTGSAVRTSNWAKNHTMYESSHSHGDVVLVVGGKRFRAHKNVLGAMSEVFHAAFTNLESENNIELEVTGHSPEAVKTMLKHCHGIRLDPHVEIDRLEHTDIRYYSDEDDYATRKMIRDRVMARRTAVQDDTIEKRLHHLFEVYLIADEYRITSLTTHITEKVHCLLNTTIHRYLKNQKRFDFLFAKIMEFLENSNLCDWSLLHVTNAFVEGSFGLKDYGTMRGPTLASIYRWRKLVTSLAPLMIKKVIKQGEGLEF